LQEVVLLIKFSANEMNNLTEIERKAIDKLRARISDTFHLRQLVLFGSKARGDFSEWSDVNILALIKEEKNWDNREKLSDITFEINMEYDTQLTCILENENDWLLEADSIWLPLKDNIVQEGITLEI
jgi:predicted nucleotidyltransferase